MMMDGSQMDGNGWWMMGGMGLFWLVLLALLVVGAVLLFRRTR